MSWMERKAKREQAQTLIAKAGGILENAAKIEKREFTEDENREFDQPLSMLSVSQLFKNII